jgi:uncharacterized protein
MNGVGLDNYLQTLDLRYGNSSLHDAIMARFEVAKTKLTAIQIPIESAVIDNSNAVQEAYAALVQLLVLLKTDMPSQLGIVINYQDGDGD